MAQDSWPSPNHNSREVTDAEYEKMAARFSDDGVYGDPASGPVVTAGTGLQVLVKANTWASLRGHAWTSGTVDMPLTIAANSSGQTRVDWVVLRLDRSTWDVRAAIKEGTPGAGSPGLTQDSGDTGVWEIGLAVVTVTNNAGSVTVTEWPQYVGSRIRPATSNRIPAYTELGEVQYWHDRGEWWGWNGERWVALYEDSGEIILSGWVSTWTANSESVAVMRNGWVGIRISVKRQGTDFSPNDSDNGSRLLQLPASLKPRRWQHFEGRFSNGAHATVVIRSDGDVWCEPPSQIVAPGRTLNLTVNYPL